MILQKRNTRRIFYCLYSDMTPITDEYGNDTGSGKIIYTGPYAAVVNVSPATGASQTEQFGNLDQYDKVLITADMECPIDEQSVLFVDKEPEFTRDGEPLCDYIVRRVAKSLNHISIAISKVKVT